MRDLLDYRAEFPILERTTYLVSHSLGAMPRAAADRLAEFARMWAERGIRSWAEGWWETPWRVGDQIGRIIGAPPGSTVMHQNVAIAEAIALSCFRPVDTRRNRVVYERGNFPSVRYLYQAQPELEVIVCESEDEIVERIDERTLVVPISHVLYKAGEIQDVAPIVSRAHEAGARVILDCYQSAGIVPLDVAELDVDFAVGGSVKWLCGGPGNGWLYVRPDLAESLEPTYTGWQAHARPFAFEEEMEYTHGAARFLTGTPNVPAHYAGTAGYDLVEEIGVERIRESSLRQTALLLELADAAGFEVMSPRDPARRGGTVTLRVPEFAAVHAELEAREILCDFRPDAGIRLGPHFYNSDDELTHVVAQIAEILGTGAYERSPRRRRAALTLTIAPQMVLNASEKTLQQIVSTVASSLELTRVLEAVVRLMSEASGVHACFAYLVSDDGERLELRAASPPYERQAGKVALERGEGLAWWAAERGEPAFIRENALADPRTKYVPELEEERFQSLLAVPIVGRSADVIGVITAQTEAPREFSDDEVDFLVTSASLVAGAIENARLYEEARLRVAELEQLTELAEAIARADALEELLHTVVAGARPLLAARACHVYLLDPAREELERVASDPEPGGARQTLGLAELGPELARGGRSSRLAIPLVANGELIGLLVAEGSQRVDLGRALASQVAVGIKKVQVIEQLTEKNLIKDFFEELAGGRPRGDLEGRAARLGCDLDQPHVVLVAEPPDDAFERALRLAAPNSLFDHREDSLRALVRLPSTAPERMLERIGKIHSDLERPISVGVSSVCRGQAAFADGFAEAQQALLGTVVLRGEPSVLSYEELGAYKYLLRVAVDGGIRDATVDAVSTLAEYDAQRGAQLVTTLEEFLRRHGSISATSEALYVHPNTLRQRLRRIAELSGLDLRRDDWLMIEIAVKMVKLRQALGAAKTNT